MLILFNSVFSEFGGSTLNVKALQEKLDIHKFTDKENN